jgi:fructose-bisphosphate aldolase class II
MPIVNLKTILAPAYAEGYAVGAFNVINLNFLESIITAAEQQKSPVILNIAEIHFEFVTIEHIVLAIKAIAEQSPVEITLNLDHGLTRAAMQRCIANGFSSIMFDGSALDLAENIRQTREVVQLCRPHNISVEAELGAVGGAEGGGLVGSADPAKYTDIEQAKIFVAKTGVDALAVAIGNSHGQYKGVPDLDFERLVAIRDVTGIPLVLHGGSGLSEQDFRTAISLGISKINFFTGMSQAALDATREYLHKNSQIYNEYPLMLEQVKNRVTEVVARQMEIFGSVGKARP